MPETLSQRLRRELQPAHLLFSLYKPGKAKYHFSARSPRAARKWQRPARAALAELLTLPGLKPAPPSPRLLHRVDRGDYIREKLLLRTSPHSVMPVYMLLPKTTPRPMPVVLALHGHGYGAKDIVGLWEDGSERDVPDGLHDAFAVRLCRRGFAVAAPEISCFGERQTDFSYLSRRPNTTAPTTCAHTAALAAHLGGSAAAIRIHDAKCLIDYVQTRRDMDASRLGAMGISGGGMHVLLSAAIDTRIRAVVISGYFCTFRDSIFAMHHCPCNFVPRLHEFGEMHDIIGLVAPRPVLIESGSRDPIFPRDAVVKGVACARCVYRVFGTERNVQTDYFEGRHQISGRRAYDFLWQRLVGES